MVLEDKGRGLVTQKPHGSDLGLAWRLGSLQIVGTLRGEEEAEAVQVYEDQVCDGGTTYTAFSHSGNTCRATWEGGERTRDQGGGSDPDLFLGAHTASRVLGAQLRMPDATPLSVPSLACPHPLGEKGRWVGSTGPRVWRSQRQGWWRDLLPGLTKNGSFPRSPRVEGWAPP